MAKMPFNESNSDVGIISRHSVNSLIKRERSASNVRVSGVYEYAQKPPIAKTGKSRAMSTTNKRAGLERFVLSFLLIFNKSRAASAFWASYSACVNLPLLNSVERRFSVAT